MLKRKNRGLGGIRAVTFSSRLARKNLKAFFYHWDPSYQKRYPAPKFRGWINFGRSADQVLP